MSIFILIEVSVVFLKLSSKNSIVMEKNLKHNGLIDGHIQMNSNDKYVNHPLLRNDAVIRRAYQENLLISCLNKNCLVILPTGLGKTIIALMLAIHKLSENEDSKIIFLAPTKPLANQHRNLFVKLTNIPEDYLILFTGAVPPDKRKEQWKDTKVLFATPQVVQNDIITNNYTLEDVSLIIFDEAHRAVGNYAYTFIAQKFSNYGGDRQILGITASPGSTEEMINTIKQNLFIDQIEIKTETDKDVKPYIQELSTLWVKIDLPEEFLEILEIFNGDLKEIYKSLKNLNLLKTEVVQNVSRTDILKINKIIDNRIAQATDDNEKFAMFNAKKLASNAIRISHMSELIETQGLKSLNKYFIKNIEEIQNNKGSKSLVELFSSGSTKRAINLTRKLIAEGLNHPKINKLKDFLLEQLLNNESSRILVFSQYRDSVNNIVDQFKEDDIVQIHKFVGQQTKGRDKGMSQKEQLEILRDFNDGIYNALVATNVAEEGLDIPDCDLVIFYDVVPSVVRSIQRRGRTGRNSPGRIVFLVAKGTRDEGYYWAERRKEKQMKESLEKMKKDEGETTKKEKNLIDFIQDLEPNKPEVSDQFDESSIGPIQGAENYLIYIDNRETASPVARTLSIFGLQIKLQHLPVGDYIVSDRVGVERKTLRDFTDSIKDGRLFSKELPNLSKTFERPILIIEGGDLFSSSTLNENALYGALISIMVNMDIFIYTTKDPIDTAKFLYQLAKKEQDTKEKKEFKIRFEKAPVKLNDVLEYIVAGIPGINRLRAQNLLEEFSKIKEIFNAEIGDLMKAPNIGKKLAQEIHKLANFNYKKDNESS